MPDDAAANRQAHRRQQAGPAENARLPGITGRGAPQAANGRLQPGLESLDQPTDIMRTQAQCGQRRKQRNPNLAGTIPSDIGTVTTLASLSLSECGLYGTMPSELGLLSDMQQMWLYGNQLSGTIPIELGNLKHLNRFEVEQNEIVGVMPAEVCSLVYPTG